MPKQKETYPLLADALGIEVNSLMDDDAEFILKATENTDPRGMNRQSVSLKRCPACMPAVSLPRKIWRP